MTLSRIIITLFPGTTHSNFHSTPDLKSSLLPLSQTCNQECTSHLLSPQSSVRYRHSNRSTTFDVEYPFYTQQAFLAQHKLWHCYLSLHKCKLHYSSLIYLALKKQATEFASINLPQPWIYKHWKTVLWRQVLFFFFASYLQGIISYSLCNDSTW